MSCDVTPGDTFGRQLSDLPHDLFIDLRASVLFTTRRSFRLRVAPVAASFGITPLGMAISIVVSKRAVEQMLRTRVHAGRGVTVMEYAMALRNQSVGQLPNYVRRAAEPAIQVTKTVSILVETVSPGPASIWSARSINVTPERFDFICSGQLRFFHACLLLGALRPASRHQHTAQETAPQLRPLAPTRIPRKTDP